MALTRLGGGIDSTANAATRTFTVGTTPTPGKRLVVVVVHTNSGSTTIKDARSNTWQLAAESSTTSSPILNVQMYSCHPTTPLVAGDVITVTHSQTTSYMMCDLYEPSEYLGADDDGKGAFNNTGTTTPSVSVSPTVTPTVTVAAVAWGGTSTTISQPSGWTQGGFTFQVGTGTSTRNLAVAESSTGATSYAASLPAAAPWATIAADFPVAVASNPVDSGASTPTTGGGSLTFAWTGVPYADGEWISTKTSGATGVRIKYATDAAVTTSPLFTAAVTPDADGYAKHHLSGLTPGTKYYYKVEVGGALASPVGSFRTNESFGTFTFAFGSCLGNTTSTAFTNAASYNPELFLHLGDWAYADNTSTSVDTHRGYIEGKIASTTGLRDLIRNVPTGYLMSDHDSGTNDWRGGPAAWTQATNDAYRQVVPNAPVVTSDTYWSFVYKGVRFIMTDSQSHSSKASQADNTSKTMFGSAQKAWIKAELSKPEKLKVLCLEGPWVWQSLDATSPKWNGYNTERAEIGKYITDNGIRCFVIHGDQHSLSADDGSHAAGGMPVLGAAPFGGKTASIKGGPYSEGNYPATETGTPSQVGIVTITNATSGATSITMAYKGVTTDNTTKIAYSKTFTVPATSPAAPSDPAPTAPGSGGSDSGGSTTPPPPVDQPPATVGDGTTITYAGADFTPTGAGAGTSASAFTALGSATVAQYVTDYVTAPVFQILGVGAHTAAEAVANNAGATFSIQRTGTWQPTSLTFKVAKGGTTTPRGLVVRSSADNYTSNLYANTDVAAVRPTMESRTVDLTALGPVTGTLTFRMYAYAPATSASLDIDDIAVALTFNTATVPAGALLASDPWTSAAPGPWTTQDNGTGAVFDIDRTDGTARITLPADSLHDLSATTRTPAMVLQPASGDFDVAVRVSTTVNGAAALRGVGLIACGATTDREVHVVSYDKPGITQRFDFAFGDTATTATSFGLLDFVSSSFDLRLKRAGTTWSYFTSADGGTTWALQDTATLTFAQSQVGFYATGQEAYTATFGAFRNLLQTGNAIGSGWSRFNGFGLAETPLHLDGYWNGATVAPLVLDRVIGSADATSPVVTVGAATGITADGATIQVTTNEPTTVSIDFGPSESNMTGRIWWTEYATSFTAVYTQLTPNTVYYSRVTATDANGNSTVSPIKTFTTAGGTPDPGGIIDQPSSGPQIVGSITKTVTSTSAAISFTTDVPAARKLLYRAANGADWVTNTRTSAPGTTHTINLGSLSSATTYTCNLYLATDSAGLATASPIVFTFATSAGTVVSDPGGSTGGSTGGGTGGTGTGTKLKWRPPTTTVDVQIPSGGGKVTLPAGKVARLIWPSSPILLPGGGTGSGPAVEINGGGASLGFHSVGGTVGWQNWRVYSGNTAQDSNGAMEINDFADGAQIYLEGFATTQKITEGVDFDMKSGKNITVTVANCLLGTETGGATGSSGTQHADALQCYGGGKDWRIDGTTMWSHYQNLFWTPSQHVSTANRDSQYTLQLRNVQFNAMSSSAYIAWIISGLTNSIGPSTVENCWFSESTVQAASKRWKGWVSASDMPGIWGDIIAAGKLRSGFSSAIARTPGNTGVNYVSPGYL